MDIPYQPRPLKRIWAVGAILLLPLFALTGGVEVVPAAAPAAVSVSPNSMVFTGIQAGPSPAGQVLTISAGGGNSLRWVATTSAPWLRLTAVTGTTPTTIVVSADTARLEAGTFTGTVHITPVGGAGTPGVLVVTLLVLAQ